MTRAALFPVAVLAAAGTWMVVGQQPVSANEQHATTAAKVWLQAAARADVNALCAAEAPPPDFSGSWAKVCPSTHDAAQLASEASKFRDAAVVGPSSTLPWDPIPGQIRVNYDQQNLSLYAVRDGGSWRIVGTPVDDPPSAAEDRRGPPPLAAGAGRPLEPERAVQLQDVDHQRADLRLPE